jgi:RimJ/RimL family protein N-acetyltransferase
MVVRPYQKGDITKIRIRIGDDWGGFSENAVLSGLAYTLFENGKPVASGGIIPAWEGVGGAWCVISDDVRGQGLRLTRVAKDLMRSTMAIMKIHRLQAFVRTDQPEYRRWAEVFGFEVEGIARCAAPDKTDLNGSSSSLHYDCGHSLLCLPRHGGG